MQEALSLNIVFWHLNFVCSKITVYTDITGQCTKTCWIGTCEAEA